MTKKLEGENIQKQADMVDRSEIQKYRKIQNEIKEKAKATEKASANYKKARQKLIDFSKNHYQKAIFINLNKNQVMNLKLMEMIKNQLEIFLSNVEKSNLNIMDQFKKSEQNLVIIDVENVKIIMIDLINKGYYKISRTF